MFCKIGDESSSKENEIGDRQGGGGRKEGRRDG